MSERYLRIRLEKAAELLRKTGLSVTAVGVACGFQSSSHFSRAFKARFGRRRVRNGVMASLGVGSRAAASCTAPVRREVRARGTKARLQS